VWFIRSSCLLPNSSGASQKGLLKNVDVCRTSHPQRVLKLKLRLDIVKGDAMCSLGEIGLRPTWKANLYTLLLVAVVLAGIFS